MQVKYLIIGAGPTGLGAAIRLQELGETSFAVLEANAYAGGLAASFKDEHGFTWDIGGHVIFSHYPYFDQLLDKAMGNEFLTHRRIARIRAAEVWTPYPYQNNIRYLPPNMQWDCVQGLLPGRRPNPQETPPQNFREWIYTVFGEGLARHFMMPYNFKVWAFPPELMAYHWIGERVSLVDLEGVLKNLILQDDNVSWGPNSEFRFPLNGGTGEIFRRLGKMLGKNLYLNSPLAQIDLQNRIAKTSDGKEFTFEHLLSTAPLDLLVKNIIKNAPPEMLAAAEQLEHNGVYVAGVGVNEQRPHEQNPKEQSTDDTCWMYFPEANCPFYRVTNLHNYSPNNVSPGGKKRALMAEVSFSKHKQEDTTALLPQVVQGLKNTSLLHANTPPEDIITWDFKAEYGYPVPTLKRDFALKVLQPWLQAQNVYSRGRFGGWRYEVGNMDHSLMQGVEWANLMLGKGQEETYKIPG